jgi:hypothetical protein
MSQPKITPALVLLAGLLPGAAQALDCNYYQTCCMELVGAYQEAGVSGADLDNFERTCHLHEVLAAMPGAQHLFCVEAWEAMSREAYRHFLQGRIGFYPDSCLAGPHEDPDAIFAPDETIPEPDPDAPLPPPEPELEFPEPVGDPDKPDFDFSDMEPLDAPDYDFSE